MMAVAVIVLLSLYSAIPAFALGVSTGGQPIRIGGSTLAQMAASDNNVYLIWNDHAQGMLFLTRSADGGHTFGNPTNLGNFATTARIAVSGNNVYVAWVSGNYGNYKLILKKSADSGITFSDNVTLATSTRDLQIQELVASSNNVYVVWTDDLPGYIVSRFIASANNGTTFGKIADLAFPSHGSIFPFIAVLGDRVNAIWESNPLINGSDKRPNLFFGVSDKSGNSFGRITPLANDTGNAFATDPRMVVLHSNVYVVWQYNPFGYGKILFRKSTDNGATFDRILYFDNNGQMGYPDVQASGSNVYVFWQSYNNRTFDIMFTNSKDNGTTFSQPVSLNENNGTIPNFVPKQVATNGNYVYVTWVTNDAENPKAADIVLRMSVDGGNTFNDIAKLSSVIESTTSNLQIATSGKNVCVAWSASNYSEENRTMNYNVFFTASNDNGNTFVKVINLTGNKKSIPEFSTSMVVLPIAIGIILFLLRFGRARGFRFVRNTARVKTFLFTSGDG